MDQCNESVGITIGPIVKTIMNASSPAALWFASFSFSDITRRLCAAILNPENGFNAHILSPYYAGKSEINDGVGKYHDRIIFTSNSLNPVKLDSIIEDVKKKTDIINLGELVNFLSRRKNEKQIVRIKRNST